MITKKHLIPTGYLFTGQYSKGQLETLSIGDYGKQYNVKADFLGFNDEIKGVPNTYCMPLSEKWVITVSTQYGCALGLDKVKTRENGCKFCSVPNIKFGGNATFNDLKQQMYNAISLFSNKTKYTERLNLHFARAGDPIFNPDVFEFAEWIYKNKLQIKADTGLSIEVIHPVLTTSLPKRFKLLEERIMRWCDIKNNLYNGQAGTQFSINSTDEAQREYMFNGNQLDLVSFSKIAAKMPTPISRKYCLNFAYCTDYTIDAQKVADLFDKDKFMIKITPIHNNPESIQNNIKTVGGYDSYAPYKKPEEDLKAKGFDVLVFVPSMDEEEGLVTCGNLILGGGKLTSNPNTILKIKGI